MKRCVNDSFGGECKGTPQITETTEHGHGSTTDPEKGAHWTKSKCALEPKTCGFFIPFSEVVKPAKNLGSGIRLIKKGEQAKPKPKTKKLKGGAEQGSFL